MQTPRHEDGRQTYQPKVAGRAATSRCAGAIGDRVPLSRQDMTSYIYASRSLPVHNRRYVVVVRVGISRPWSDSCLVSPRSSQYLCDNQPVYCFAWGPSVIVLAIFWLRMSSSLTTLSTICFEFSSSIRTFHYASIMSTDELGA
jgi:hypothetical protein